METTFSTVMYAFHVILHPFDGFWELKHHKKHTMKSALILLFITALVFLARVPATGFLFQSQRPEEVNMFFQLTSLVLPVLAWSVLNWALSTLMEGKAKMGQIFVSTVYALFPMVLLYIPQMILSHFFIADEASFYYFFSTLAAIWSLGLILIGNMTIQDYTMKKTIVMGILTILGFIGVSFLCMVFFSTIQQLFTFFYTIYAEIRYAV